VTTTRLPLSSVKASATSRVDSYAFLTSVLEKSSPLNSSGNPERFAKA
jgi:hypothetical protein